MHGMHQSFDDLPRSYRETRALPGNQLAASEPAELAGGLKGEQQSYVRFLAAEMTRLRRLVDARSSSRPAA